MAPRSDETERNRVKSVSTNRIQVRMSALYKSPFLNKVAESPGARMQIDHGPTSSDDSAIVSNQYYGPGFATVKITFV